MKTLKKLAILCCCILLCVALTACSKNGSTSAADGKKPVIVCTTFPVYDFARAVTENLPVDLVLLIKPGQEVHSYEPSPRDLITIQNASVLLCVGGESDEWVNTLLKGKEFRNVPVVRLMESVALLDEPDALEAEDEDDETDGLHIDEADEHIWTNPENARHMVAEILTETLKVTDWDEKARDTMKNNALAYMEQIAEVEKTLQTIVQAASDPFIVMADRFPLVYMAEYYGIGYAAAFNGCSSAVEASSATISRLIELVKEKQLPCVYYIELSNHKIADVVAAETGVSVRMLHSVQNVTKDEFESGATWVRLMKQNADVLRNGLR